MAVFPERIVLKNSADSEAAITSAIGLGGTDQIAPGEIVLGLAPGAAALYTLDSAGSVVKIVSGGTSLVSGVSTVNNESGEVLLAGSDLTDVHYNGDPKWSNVTFFFPGYGPVGQAPTATFGSLPSSVSNAVDTTCVLAPSNAYSTSTAIANGRLDLTVGNITYFDSSVFALEMTVRIPDPNVKTIFCYDGTNSASDYNLVIYYENGSIVAKVWDQTANSLVTVTAAKVIDANDWGYLSLQRITATQLKLEFRGSDGSYGSGTANVGTNDLLGNKATGTLTLGATTTLGATSESSTVFIENFRITKGTTRNATFPIPESVWGPSSFKNNGIIQVDGDTLVWNNTKKVFQAGGNYGRAIVSATTPPTVDGNGLSVKDGQFWYDSDTDKLYTYYSSTWNLTAGGGSGGVTSINTLTGDVSLGLGELNNVKPTGLDATLMLNGNGANGGTTFTDSSPNAYAMSVYSGSPTTSTAQVKYGSASLYFNGSSSIQVTSTTDSAAVAHLDGNDFTVEFWVYPTQTTSGFGCLKYGISNSINPSWFVSLSTNGGGTDTLVFRYSTNGTTSTIVSAAAGKTLLNTWSHVAVCRSGSALKGYIDGAEVFSEVISGNIAPQPSYTFIVGEGISGTYASGYFDDVRILNGTAIYKSAFTPPTAELSGTAFVPNDGQVLSWSTANNRWEPVTLAGGGGPIAIDDLTDVDTTTSAPTTGQVLEWDGTNWVPATPSAGGATAIDDLTDVDTSTTPPLNGQSLVWNGTKWVPSTVSGGGGGGGSTGTVLDRTTDTGTASSGLLTLTGIGSSGVLVDVTSSLDAWITFYPSDAARTADAGRGFGADPTPGSGVLAEFYITAAGTVLASPGTTYFNNDTIVAEAIYLAVRDQAGAPVDSEITVDAYVHKNFGGFGTIRVSDSGTAASGALDLTGMGQSGQLCTITSDLDAWIVLYGSAADRTADAGRAYNTDPTPGDGVQAEFYVAAGTTVLATPGMVYFNNDTSPTDAMYLAVRDQAGASVNATVTIIAYAETSYTGVSGGTFGSG